MLSCLASRTLLTGHISKIPERPFHMILVATRKAFKNVIGEDSGRIFMSDLARATATCRRVSSVSIHQHICQRPYKPQQTYLHIPMRKFSSAPPSPAEVLSVKKENGGDFAGQPQRTLLTKLQEDGASPRVLWDALQEKCKGQKLPRRQDLHALFLSASRNSSPEAKEKDKALLLSAVDLFLYKNVEFREASASLFLRAMLRLDGLGEAVDALLAREKRLGLWAQRKMLHMALHRLGVAKDTERLLKLFDAMEPFMNVNRSARYG
ncbi:hypothetical protein NGA_0442502 [Nannochloropsis gaditana CCMP526]|uniref:uncharacterized protein n=1 Tax=Nannochloropsis gaditana (strain CCMP526) TaxID=1093141 RepID=UPI00029F5A17|nr:hypothetical protein NGA_0442502 [Nannochloropsis gaditana CCMP526]XP_005854026.1 hypothetical protein NGA_0442501 [Nannochloropsis gaditana CCMP526]EKU22336.1 hypothetical protein NGA_0442501 [Nannochloropsis gaditana CCMP526]EKU22383.1 hypothetical protein NGA_0442502 [Nannochloropsis gaditana CCMP526]|eukprot:XP_005853975.1 hypothetical protein NGA_0442502 [Nannochloropsis gaditana CCMP526]